MTAAEAQAILDHESTCVTVALLLDTGVRIGEALGLRHEDLDIAEPRVAVVPHANDNRARAKGGLVPVPSRRADAAYANYLNDEYGSLDSDYVSINLWRRPHEHPLTYPAVYDPGGTATATHRSRVRSALVPAHLCDLVATPGAGMDSVKELLGHASITSTVDTYGHLTIEDASATLEDAGWFTGREVRL